jgi:hypothetical protein
MMDKAQQLSNFQQKINEIEGSPSSFIGDGLSMGNIRAQMEMELWRLDAARSEGQATSNRPGSSPNYQDFIKDR